MHLFRRSPRKMHAVYAQAGQMFLTPAERKASQEHIATIKNPPCFLLSVEVSGMHEIALRKSINSILDQTYPHWKCTVLYSRQDTRAQAMVAAMQRSADGRLHGHCIEESMPEESVRHAYRLHLPPHAQLRDDTLQRLMTAACIYPSCTLRCTIQTIAYDDFPLQKKNSLAEHYLCQAVPTSAAEEGTVEPVMISDACVYVPASAA